MKHAAKLPFLGLFILIGYAFCMLAPFELAFPVTWYNADEGFILYKSYLVSLGKLPYADFDPFWPPLVYYLNGALFKIFGIDIMVAKYGIAVFVGLLGSICMFAIASKIMPKWIAALCATSFIFCGPPILNVPYSSWYAAPIGLAGLYAVFIALERKSLLAVLFAGIAAGLAFSFKQSIGAFVGSSFALMGLFWKEPIESSQAQAESALRLVRSALAILLCVGLPLIYVTSRTASNLMYLSLPALVACVLVLWLQGKELDFNDKPGASSLARLSSYEVILSLGFLIAITPWFGYLAVKIGFFETLKNVLLLGQAWRLRDMVVPFPQVNRESFIFPMVLIGLSLSIFLLWNRRKSRKPAILFGGLVAIQIFLLFYWGWKGILIRYFLSRNWDIDIYMLIPPALVACFVLFVVGHARGKNLSKEGLFSLCLFIYSVLLLQQSFPYVDLNHFTFGFAPWIVLCFFLTYRLAVRLQSTMEVSTDGGIFVALIFVIPLFIFLAGRTLGPARLLIKMEQTPGGWSLKWRNNAPLDIQGSEIVFDSNYSQMFSETAKYLKANTLPSDMITGLPSLAIFNVLTERLTPTKFVYMWPEYFSQEEVRRTAEEIRNGKPKYVVISNAPSSPGDVFSYRYYAEEYPEIARTVDELYEPEVSIGIFTIMRQKPK